MITLEWKQFCHVSHFGEQTECNDGMRLQGNCQAAKQTNFGTNNPCLCRLPILSMVFWQFTLRCRWCRQYHHHLHCYRCYGPSWIANCQPYGDFFFYLPITSDINVELMIENFLSLSTNTIYEEEKKKNSNDNRKCRLENSSTKVRLWRSRRDRILEWHKSICTTFSGFLLLFHSLSFCRFKKYMAFFLSSKSNKFIECRQPSRQFSSLENVTYVCVCFLLSLPFPIHKVYIWFFFALTLWCRCIELKPIHIPYCTRTINKLSSYLQLDRKIV